MSSPLRINEELIAGAKFSSGKSSPGASRESSGERRGRPSLSDIAKGKRTNSRDSSSEYGSSRDSSLENKGKTKIDKKEKGKNFAQINGGTIVNSEIKKKRGRPKSLDLTSKTVMNGDDDKFKSPVPLTPCNVFVKRRKGRPKETPPTLVAETPVTPEILDGTSATNSSDAEEEIKVPEDKEPPKRKAGPGRPPKKHKKGKLIKKETPGISKTVKPGKFNIKRPYNKTALKKLPKLTKMKQSTVSFEQDPKELVTMTITDGTEVPVPPDDKANGSPEVVKRKPGRPPGAKNKPKTHLSFLTKSKRTLTKIKMSNGKSKFPIKKKVPGRPGRPPGRKNKAVESQNLLRESNSKEKSATSQIEPSTVPEEPEIVNTVENFEHCSDNEDCVEISDEKVNGEEEFYEKEMTDLNSENNEFKHNIDDAINSVVFKAGHDLPLTLTKHQIMPAQTKIRKGGVTSLGKLKKMKHIVNKVRKKRILLKHKHLDSRTIDVLSSNDLRRKLHEKLLQKMRLSDTSVFPDYTGNNKTEEKIEVKPELQSSDIVKSDNTVFKTEVFYSSDQKHLTMTDNRPSKTVIKGRKPSVDVKGSDTESISSEMSTLSHGSAKKHVEKHIIVLGEEHNDSDDSSIRTRQRFDIVPGKKRKRTLSGEFDLLDEKQLRKDRKLAEKGVTEDDMNFQKKLKAGKKPKISSVKRSPKWKNKRLIEKYGTTFEARKIQLKKQSPFLTYKKRRKKGFKNNMLLLSPLRKVSKSEIQQTMCSGIVDEIESRSSKLEMYRKGLFEQFDTVNIAESEKGISSLKELCENALKMPLKEAGSRSPRRETELVVSALISELLDNVISICEPESVESEKMKINTDMLKNADMANFPIQINDANDKIMTHKICQRKKPGKAKRRKFGPLPIARKVQPYEVIKAPKGKKKMSKSTARKTSRDGDMKSSPEQLMTRKFELRQKISRSPLDNIALKQSLEETKYMKAEQLRAMKKEEKLKTKLRASNQDSMDSLQSDISEASQDQHLSLTIDSVHTAGDQTLADLKKTCRPCKVVLVNFLKNLQIHSNDPLSSSECETSIDESLDTVPVDQLEDSIRSEDKDNDNLVNSEAPKGYEKENEGNECKDTKQSSDTDESSKSNNNNIKFDKNVGTFDKSRSEIEKHNDVAVQKDSKDNQSKLEEQKTSPIRIKYSDLKKEEAKVSLQKKGSPENKSKVSNSSLKVKKKAETIVKPQSAETTVKPHSVKPLFKTKKSEHKSAEPEKPAPNKVLSPEPQTARKTVPPLKIKVKGLKRKTYTVETHPDSPVENDADTKNKPDKKKKSKSGNKSESSDTEKHSKSHHHHKKRNKSPLTETKPKAENSNHISPTKQIKATDAYEANFLQFIQDTSKAEQSIQTVTLSQKTKYSKGLANSKVNKNVNEIAVSAATVELAVANPPQFSPASEESSNLKSDDNEVRYVCSECDNIEYKSEELILKHYQQVHPGAQVMYRPLPDNPPKADADSGGLDPFSASGDHSQSNEKEINEVVEPNTGEEDDSGSLNLKIVDVVSLKDQENLLDINDVPQSKPAQPTECKATVPTETFPIPQIASMTNMVSKPMLGTELRIPNYRMPVTLTNVNPIMTSVNPVNPNAELYKHLLKSVPKPGLPGPLDIQPLQQKHVPPTGKIANTFKCDKCNVHAPHLAAMVAHLRNSHKDIPNLFQCPFCKWLEAESEAKIHQHIKLNHPSDNPNPPVALSEPAKQNLKTLSVHLPEKYKLSENNMLEQDIIQCLKCKVHMPSMETFYDHLEQNHSEVFVYVCPYCKEFKSSTEAGVSVHILHVHRKSAADVNISIAIDGNHFTRVTCLVKDKPKKHHGPASNSSKQSHPVSNVHHTNPHVVNSLTNHLNNIGQKPQYSRPQTIANIPTPQQNHLQTLATLTLQASKQTHGPLHTQEVHHPQPSPATSDHCVQNSVASKQQPLNSPAPPVHKKKKNLLESIEQLKAQKELEQQGILSSKSPSNSSLQNTTTTKSVSGAPPPLMRAPPPLIRYDQLDKVSSNQSLVSTTVKMSTAAASNNPSTSESHNALASLQRLQTLSNPKSPSINTNLRPIQSSLFDTSDLESVKTPSRPVLNVPVVTRATGSPATQGGGMLSPKSQKGSAGVLDLSAKSTPSSSPVPQQTPSPKQPHANIQKDIVNPDMFKVFNLRPNVPLQLQRPAANTLSAPTQAVQLQPLLFPQQVRHNTPSTLAYRPPGSQMVPASQIPQIINMPMGAVIGNMVMSLGSVSAGVQSLQGIPAQVFQLASPALPATSMVSVSSSAQPIPIMAAGQPVQGARLVNVNDTTFKCPYCRDVVPLSFAQVKPHIESQHPGSSIVLLPLDPTTG